MDDPHFVELDCYMCGSLTCNRLRRSLNKWSICPRLPIFHQLALKRDEKNISFFLVSFCSCSLLLLRSLPQICYVTRANSGYKRDYDLITIHWSKTGCRRKFTPFRNSEVSIYMGHECIIVTWYIPNQRIVVFVLDRDNNLLSIRSYTPKLPFSTECWWIITRLRAIPHYQGLGTSASSLAGKNEASWALRVRERSARV